MRGSAPRLKRFFRKLGEVDRVDKVEVEVEVEDFHD